MTKHKWHKEIKAWADGEDVEVRWTLDNGTWSDWKLIYDPYFCWLDKNEYRIKPQPKEPQYLYVSYHPQNSSIRLLDYEDKNSYYIGKIKLEDTK